MVCSVCSVYLVSLVHSVCLACPPISCGGSVGFIGSVGHRVVESAAARQVQGQKYKAQGEQLKTQPVIPPTLGLSPLGIGSEIRVLNRNPLVKSLLCSPCLQQAGVREGRSGEITQSFTKEPKKSDLK